MPKLIDAPTKLDEVRHEFFCPAENGGEARVEGYPHYSDDASGRSKQTHFITRCMECAAQTIRPLT